MKRETSEGQKREDLRVRKSIRSIRGAFWDLMAREGFDAMTVAQIISEAEIGRSTFYAHYQDKFDLLDREEAALLEGLERAALGDGDALSPFHEHLLRLLGYFRENGRHFVLLVRDGGDPSFRQKLYVALHDVAEAHQAAARLGVPDRYLIAAASGMMTSVIVEWVSSGMRESDEELASIIDTLVGPTASVLSGR
ncbi:MAG: TetR/AcrR family transcriptional regulator [Tractidigestivibacter sp.]|jgi:AcrR family transcriptional regulator|uniref:TetR/AcrR family transcriptional regulator n=1 Tax=Tractidigestivibacter sp. TaxID=2847320 RepID=UPI003D8DA4FE